SKNVGSNPPRRIRRQPDVAIEVEPIDGVQQSQIALLDQVRVGAARAATTLCMALYERLMGCYDARPGLGITVQLPALQQASYGGFSHRHAPQQSKFCAKGFHPWFSRAQH